MRLQFTMILIRIWTFCLLAIVVAYPYPPSTLLLTIGTPASSYQADKAGTYCISAGEIINGAPVWRHTASGNKLYADACEF